MEELNRVSAENQKLTQMLTVMCENYDALRKHLMDYMDKNPSSGGGGTDDINNNNNNNNASKKRKLAESSSNINNDTIVDAAVATTTNGPSESSSSDEGSCKKPREEHIKSKISRVYVRTEASDTSLVSSYLVINCLCLISCFILSRNKDM